MKRGISDVLGQIILVLVLVVVLAIVFGRPLYAQTKNVVDDISTRLGMKQITPPTTEPTGPLRENFISLWKVEAGGALIPPTGVDDQEQLRQVREGTLILDRTVDLPLVKKLPLTLQFDVPVGNGSQLPIIRLRFCQSGNLTWRQQMAAGNKIQYPCTFAVDYPCSHPSGCLLDKEGKVLTIPTLPAVGWYQLDVLSGANNGQINSNTATVKFEFRP